MSKYNQQIAAWAIDRAIETTKQNPNGERTAKQVTEIAEAYCAWMATVSADEPSEDAELEAKLMAGQPQGEA